MNKLFGWRSKREELRKWERFGLINFVWIILRGNEWFEGFSKSIHIQISYLILFYHPKKLFYQLYHTILQYTQHPNFYFSILLIKIIFLHNKIIYPTITIIYNKTHYLFFLSLYFCSTTTITTTATLHTPDTTTPPPAATHNLPPTHQKKKPTLPPTDPKPTSTEPQTPTHCWPTCHNYFHHLHHRPTNHNHKPQ